MLTTTIELIQSILLIIIAIITIIVSIGMLRLDNDMKNVFYARIHILGAIDVMAIITFIVLNYPILGVLYFILTPFAAHVIAHGFYYAEDTDNTEPLETDENISTEDNSVTEDLTEGG